MKRYFITLEVFPVLESDAEVNGLLKLGEKVREEAMSLGLDFAVEAAYVKSPDGHLVWQTPQNKGGEEWQLN